MGRSDIDNDLDLAASERGHVLVHRSKARWAAALLVSCALSFVRPAQAQQATMDGKGDANEGTGSSDSPDAGRGAGFRVHGLLLGTKAMTPYQSREFGFGAGGLAAFGWGPSALWAVQVELGVVGLGGSKKSPPTGLAELQGAAGGHLVAGLRLNPFATSKWKESLGGLWLSGGVGAAFTGGLVAPAFDVFVGYDFAVTRSFSLGPTLGYLLVMQTDKESPRPENANLALLGINGSFAFGSPQVSSDKDHDGIVDKEDGCPTQPEDQDGFKDEDGCPDLDNDEDGIPDHADRCPLDPEDLDQFEDADGCPEIDNDVDQVLDVDDACVLEPEDHDGYLDDDGCPELDNDEDKIPDLKDLCPNEAETLNGTADNDGCPDTESVRVVGDKIELDQKIHFWTNSDVIRGMSYPVLDKLARFLVDHPEYIHVDIEGHADERGDEATNLDLSRRRAHSIMEFLAKHGVQEARLSSDGFGSSRPLVDAQNEGAWFMNRRVEFVVTRNREVKVVVSAPEQDAPAFGRDQDEVQEPAASPPSPKAEEGAP